MQEHQRPSRIVLDWGTTSFRALLIGHGGKILDRVETSEGVQSVSTGGFADVLERSLGAWLTAHTHVKIYAAGMVGSRNGWIEVPYVPVPAEGQAIAAGARSIELATGNVVTIIPGLIDLSARPFPDVMRGEETQLLGLGLAEDAIAVLPGTHSKWARIEGRAIARFRTFVTGELFATLSRHSFIASMAQPPAERDWPAFVAAVEMVREARSGEGLLGQLFAVRTGWLAAKIAPTAVADFLSGILVAAEFREARDQGWFRDGASVTILAGADLADVYRRAASAFGLNPSPGPADAAMRGCLAVAQILENRSDAP